MIPRPRFDYTTQNGVLAPMFMPRRNHIPQGTSKALVFNFGGAIAGYGTGKQTINLGTDAMVTAVCALVKDAITGADIDCNINIHHQRLNGSMTQQFPQSDLFSNTFKGGASYPSFLQIPKLVQAGESLTVEVNARSNNEFIAEVVLEYVIPDGDDGHYTAPHVAAKRRIADSAIDSVPAAAVQQRPSSRPVRAKATGSYASAASSEIFLSYTCPAGQRTVINQLLITDSSSAAGTVPSAPGSISGNVLGTPGTQSFDYYVVAKGLYGNSDPEGPFSAVNAPDIMGAPNGVKINWSKSANALSYDVVRVASGNGFPSAAGNYLIGNTSALTISDYLTLPTNYDPNSTLTAINSWHILRNGSSIDDGYANMDYASAVAGGSGNPLSVYIILDPSDTLQIINETTGSVSPSGRAQVSIQGWMNPIGQKSSNYNPGNQLATPVPWNPADIARNGGAYR